MYDMSSRQALLSELTCFSDAQKATLGRAGFTTVRDLVLTRPSVVSKKCKIRSLEVQRALDAVCAESQCTPHPVEEVKNQGQEHFTTGDSKLDHALGGGIRTGMIWEVVGESATGKTQLALQLSLTVQLSPGLGGLSGSACYLTTSSQLPTGRLLQICESHPQLSPQLCGLAEVRTLTAETIPKLLFVLSHQLPQLIQRLASDAGSKPVKLLVIDALAELFHSAEKTTTTTLVERSRSISEISNVLHTFAYKHGIAVLVLNEVTDVFASSSNASARGELIYREQARWFGRADNVPEGNRKEAALGLVWANQVNARIMLSRTDRRRFLSSNSDRVGKRRRLNDQTPSTVSASKFENDQPTLIRRLNVIFSSVSSPASLDYVVTASGISAFVEEDDTSQILAPVLPTLLPQLEDLPATQVSPLDEGCLHDEISSKQLGENEADAIPPEDDDDAEYWKGFDIDAVLSAVELHLNSQ